MDRAKNLDNPQGNYYYFFQAKQNTLLNQMQLGLKGSILSVSPQTFREQWMSVHVFS